VRTLLGQPPAARGGTAGLAAADAMVRFPKTLGPETGVNEIRLLFDDDHVHIALVVAADGRLITTIERTDLAAAVPSSTPVVELGTLVGRVVGPSCPLDAATAALVRQGRRRLAVVDRCGRLLGLLCLKRDGTGYCTDEGIRARADEARCSQGPLLRQGWSDSRERRLMGSVLHQNVGSAGRGVR
jgi:hypothetical protein